MRSSRFGAVLVGILLWWAAGPAQGGEIVWDQQPLDTGGPGADTDFINDSGTRVWQQVADDIVLVEDATIGRIVWWGFYGGGFTGDTSPPEGPETMRVRFYDARPGDGLPGLPGGTLYEETFLNPSRTPTGRYVLDARLHPEYVFEVDLTTPFELQVAVPYWLEILQVGDVDSHFRWEVSPGTGTPYAYLNPFVPDWQRTTNSANVAFQLWIPEPGTLTLFLVGFVLAGQRRRRRKEVRVSSTK